MKSTSNTVFLSYIDEERFGIRTARAPNITMETLSFVTNFCRDNAVILLIARCLVSELRAAQAMEREGFSLMDTLLYYKVDLQRKPIPADTGKVTIRPLRRGEEDTVKVIASEAFRGYHGHYHSDERLDNTKCDEVYTSWAIQSCTSRDIADEVLVIALNDTIIGFHAMRLNSQEEGEAILGGMLPEFQGRGLYKSLMIGSMNWCLSKKATRMAISSQITNKAAQKNWARLGFEFDHAYYTFHKWFDRP